MRGRHVGTHFPLIHETMKLCELFVLIFRVSGVTKGYADPAVQGGGGGGGGGHLRGTPNCRLNVG